MTSFRHSLLFLVATTASLFLFVAAEKPPLLQAWLRGRCGPTGNGLWVYQGALYDPLDGKKIANVQGLEFVRLLATTDSTEDQKERYARRCGDLLAVDSLTDPEATMDFAGTVLSRKLFCYTKPDEEGDSRPSSFLLRNIRLRPNSPLRKVPVEQAATVFDTATTVVQRGNEWIVHTEWPDRRAVWTRTDIKTEEEDDEDFEMDALTRGRKYVEFTAYARPMPRWRHKLPTLSKTFQKERKENDAVVTSPQRSALVQFGNNGQQEVSKYGARETYQYTVSPSSRHMQVRYTRYGEGPIWYGPGRLCTLELTGRRVNSWSDVPPLVARVASERVLGFLSVNSPIANDDVLAARSVEWFRGKGSARLQVAPEIDNKPGWVHAAQLKCAKIVSRIRSATSMTIGGSSE